VGIPTVHTVHAVTKMLQQEFKASSQIPLPPTTTLLLGSARSLADNHTCFWSPGARLLDSRKPRGTLMFLVFLAVNHTETPGRPARAKPHPNTRLAPCPTGQWPGVSRETAAVLICAAADVNVDVFGRARPGYTLLHLAGCNGVNNIDVSCQIATGQLWR
jgi:hypothetical protein